MKLLQYAELDTAGLEPAFERVTALLEAGEFAGAEVKKLTGRPFYRAKLSAADRLLFQFGTYKGETYLILLEVIRNHAYEHARFLRGAQFDEDRLTPLTRPEPADPADALPLRFVNPNRRQVHVLDKVLSFDDDQEEVLLRRPPLILIGSAGSGKTVLTIAKLRQLRGEILYVTRSPYLVDSSRRLYFAQGYENDQQDVTFLSFLDFVNSIQMPAGRPLSFEAFGAWFSRHRSASPVKDAHALYEEFAGVLSGSMADRPYLSLEDYLGLGIRRSIFPPEDRPAVHGLWMKYLAMLKHEGFYDLNLVCYDHHARCRPTYDFIVADEVQDLTTVQISLILKSLKHPDQFVLCGDSNQIVHPNFFSWAAVKTYFHSRQSEGSHDITRVLSSNYRNSPEVTALANRLLLIKNARFGSIDRESHYLVRSVADLRGTVELLVDSDSVRRDIDAKTGRSARVALLVPRKEDKADAARIFRTPLVFSIQEAKGLEYETVVLLNFVSGNARSFSQIAEGVRGKDLEGEFAYARARDKTDRSLEAYKFFVNALYVGVTRAVRNVYLLERSTGHPLLELLRLRETAAAKMRIEGRESTADEWKEEARKLEAQGKAQQAEAIRKTILRTEPVPWAVISPATIEPLKTEALATQPVRPKARKLLLDYAVTFTDPALLAALQKIGFAPARKPEAAYRDAQQRYAVAYHQRGYRDLLRAIERHGVDYRDPLNRTPLMLAVKLGLAPLVERLVGEGASTVAQDNWGRIPLQIALRTAFENPFYAKASLGPIYDAVAPATLDAQLGGRLIRVDRHRMEFFILHAMIAQFEFMVRDKVRNDIPAYETADFIGPLEHFPESVIPARRRKRQALSATLASQEVFRANTGAGINRRLFVRVKRGYYLPNPCLSIRLGEEWVAMTQVLAIDQLRKESGNRLLKPLMQCIARAEKEIQAAFCTTKDAEGGEAVKAVPTPRRRRRAPAATSSPESGPPHAAAQQPQPDEPAASPASATALPEAADAQPQHPADAAVATPHAPPAASREHGAGATAAAPDLPRLQPPERPAPRADLLAKPLRTKPLFTAKEMVRARANLLDLNARLLDILEDAETKPPAHILRELEAGLREYRPFFDQPTEAWLTIHEYQARQFFLTVLHGERHPLLKTPVKVQSAVRLACDGESLLFAVLWLALESTEPPPEWMTTCGPALCARLLVTCSDSIYNPLLLELLGNPEARPWSKAVALAALSMGLREDHRSERPLRQALDALIAEWRVAGLPEAPLPAAAAYVVRWHDWLHTAERLEALVGPIEDEGRMRDDLQFEMRALYDGLLDEIDIEMQRFGVIEPPANTGPRPGELPLDWVDAASPTAQPHARDDDPDAPRADNAAPAPAFEWAPDQDDSWGLGREAAYASAEPFRKTEPAAGRNDPCPCGSGKKYKRCCGA